MSNKIKSRTFPNFGTYSVEYIKLSFPINESYFYEPFEYNFDGIKYIGNEDQLVSILSEFFKKHELYDDKDFNEDFAERIDNELERYLNNVPRWVRRIFGHRKFINLEDITFKPYDYLTSRLARPEVVQYYESNKDVVRWELKSSIIERKLLEFLDDVVDDLMSLVTQNIENRVKVTWEVPHSIYKSDKPISDSDIFNKKIKPYAKLSKYENEYYDYDVGFNDRVFYKVVEHLPSGDRILPFSTDINDNDPVGHIYNDNMRSYRKTVNHERNYEYSTFRDIEPCDENSNENCRGNAEFFVPFPFIRRRPECRGGNILSTTRFPHEARFTNTRPRGGSYYSCPRQGDPEPPKNHLVHQFDVFIRRIRQPPGFQEIVRRSFVGSSIAGNLSYTAPGTKDIRDFEPPKLVSNDNWFTTPDHDTYGEYPSLQIKQEEEWWEDYRNKNINNESKWHEFWEDKIKENKDDLVWYINNHIKR